MLLAFACGCGLLPRRATAVRRVYADLPQLLPLHPGFGPLRELDAEIRSLSTLAGVKEELPALPVPPPVEIPLSSPPHAPGAEVGTLVSHAQAAGEEHLQALGQELAEARARKLAPRRAELTAALEEETRAEKAALKESQAAEEDAVFRKFRRQLFNLRENLARKNLPSAEKEKLQAQLRRTETEQETALAEVRRQHQEKLAVAHTEKTTEVEKALAGYEAQLRAEDDALVSLRRKRMQAELAQAASRLQTPPRREETRTAGPPVVPTTEEITRQLRGQQAAARGAITTSRTALLSQLDKLRAARARLRASLQQEVEAALQDIGTDRGLQFVFDFSEAKSLPDSTADAAAWLKNYWSQ